MPKNIIQKIKEKINEQDFPISSVNSIALKGNIIDEEQLVNHIKDLRIGDHLDFNLCACINTPILNKKNYLISIRKDEEGYSVAVEKQEA